MIRDIFEALWELTTQLFFLAMLVLYVLSFGGFLT